MTHHEPEGRGTVEVVKWGYQVIVTDEFVADVGYDEVRRLLIAQTASGARRDGYEHVPGGETFQLLGPEHLLPFAGDDLPPRSKYARITIRCVPASG